VSFQLGPCPSPQAAVNDVLPRAIRCKWYYLATFALLSWAIFDVRDFWLPSLGAMPLAAGGVLAALLSMAPLGIIAARRSAATPWWFDSLIIGVLVSAVAGAWLGDGVLLIIGLLPAWLLVGEIALALYRVEARYPVRVYSRRRSLVFVEV
jgi:hypothetical protein